MDRRKEHKRSMNRASSESNMHAWRVAKEVQCVNNNRFLIGAILPMMLMSAVPKENITIVHNSGRGAWDGDSTKKLELIAELQIGKLDGIPEERFTSIADVAVDGACNIYILNGESRSITKFDSTGVFRSVISVKTDTDGESSIPAVLAVDRYGSLYVGRTDREIAIFSSEGAYRGSFELDFKSGALKSIEFDSSGNMYVSVLDIMEQTMIHKYSPQGELVRSFCDSYAKGLDIDVRVESVFASGDIDISDKDMIYYSQSVPYEIRAYTESGELLMRILNDNYAWLQESPATQTGPRDTMTIDPPAGSYEVAAMRNGTVMSFLRIPSSAGRPGRTFVDLYDPRGTLLMNKELAGYIYITCHDARGRIYAMEAAPFLRVLRYRLSWDGNGGIHD